MERKIIFRGKNDKGQWVYGQLFASEKDTLIVSGIYHVDGAEYNVEETEVKPKTVGQFTGLKENAFELTELNSNIYEDDIIEFINGEKLAVEWNDDTCNFQFSDGSLINDGERYGTHKKIIGNIHDNPEFLN